MNGTASYMQSDDDFQNRSRNAGYAATDSDFSESRLQSRNGQIDSEADEHYARTGLTSSQINRAMADDSDTSPPPRDNTRDADSAMTRMRKDQSQRIQQIIQNVKERRLVTLELRDAGLKALPSEILELSHLQYLYLEGNELTSLPDNFFDCLPDLRWLDLRRNYLAHLPSTYIGSHRNLNSLLLEGNELKTLPLEIGLIPTLNGLNIHNNPLEFPPAEVIERGTQSVLQFMRDLLKAKSQGRLDDDSDYKQYTRYISLDLTGAPRIEDLLIHSDEESSEDDAWDRSPPRRRNELALRNSSKDSRDSGLSDSDLVGPVPTSAALHKPTSYNELKQKQIDKIRKAGAMGTVEKKSNEDERLILPLRKKKDKKLMKANMYPEPPAADRVKQRFMAEQQLYRERELNEKEDLILQKRKDNEQLRQWRQDGRTLQQERYHEARIYGGAREQVDIAKKAPFGIEKEHLKIPSNEERIAQAVKESHEKMRRRRVLSPRSQAKTESERVARDKELEKRIKSHMLTMQDRRRAPKGTPQEEMEASKRELEIANQLQSEIEARRKQLEYRFTAFTG